MKKNNLIFLMLFWHIGLGAQTVNFTQSTLPIVIVNASLRTIPDEPKIMATMKIVFNGVGQINRVSDQTFHFEGTIGIERRGSTSQSISEKKPYSIEVRDMVGEDTAVALLGMPKESDWALIAPYSDKTLIRDALTYRLAGSFMAWSPRTRFCELVINGEYQGVYVLTEKIKRDKNRVNIAKTDQTNTAGDELTGGYILKIDKPTGNIPGVVAGFSSVYSNIVTLPNSKTYFQYEYPSAEDILSVQRTYIQTAVAEMERAMSLSNPAFSDPSVGYPKYWDTKSLVDFFIMNEITRNVDGYRLSTYFYKDRNNFNSKFKMGPVWDFNIALGNADYCSGSSITGWAANNNNICPSDTWSIPFWWRNLMADDNFRKDVRSRWVALRTNELSNSRINSLIDSMTLVLGNAPSRNFQKWQILGRYVWPNSFIGTTYASEINYLKQWLTDRIAWIDGQIATFPVGQKEIVDKATVSPNPSVSGFTFDYVLKSEQEVKLHIFNELGQLVFQKTEGQTTGNQQMYWHSTNAPRGLYFYEIQTDAQKRMLGKIVKN
ncbi:MAG: CotH kinase family protein [Saprospiraceae bacterium]|nr:CotH kinase family protein [Saprospiraceae bacterium]